MEFKMLEKVILLVLGILIITSSANYAMVGEEDKYERTTIGHPLQNSPFKELPNELVISIAEYLYGDDFHNFALICKPIRKVLMTHKGFFMPEEKTKVIEKIQETSLEKIQELILNWSRTGRKKSIPLLRSVLPTFEDFKPQINEKNLKTFQKNFKNYVKNLNLLYVSGDNKTIKIFKDLYYENQVGFENAMNNISENSVIIKNPLLYKFYQKRLSLLDP